MGVGGRDFRDKLKIGVKLENAHFPRVLELNFPNLSLNGMNIFHFTILTQNTPLQFKNGAKHSKKILNKFSTGHSLTFESLPSFISELNPKFEYAPPLFFFLVEVWLAKISI